MDTLANLPQRPKWFDRQIIAAADLTAEQAWQDAQLARLRRFALGWGVVAGLDALVGQGSALIRPGYGLTALGHEVYLDRSYLWPDLFKALIASCAPDWGPSCDLPAIEHDDTEVPPNPRTAWIVLRPETVEGCPRPSVPEGCASPGNALYLSRQGAALRFDLACELAPNYLMPDPDCTALRSYLDGGVVPMPEADLDDILPVAQVTFDSNGILEITTQGRRQMLPMSVLQGLIACCDCGVDEPPPPDPEPEPDPEPIPETSPWADPGKSHLHDLIAEFDGFLPGTKRSLTLTFATMFGEKTKLPDIPGRPQSTDQALLQSLAAAILVDDRTGFDLWWRGEYLAIYAVATAKAPRIARGLTGAGRIANASLTDPTKMTLGAAIAAWPSLPVVDRLRGTMSGKDVTDLGVQGVLKNRLALGDPATVALGWMQARLSAILASV